MNVTALEVKGQGQLCPLYFTNKKLPIPCKTASKPDRQFSNYMQFSYPKNTKMAFTVKVNVKCHQKSSCF